MILLMDMIKSTDEFRIFNVNALIVFRRFPEIDRHFSGGDDFFSTLRTAQ